MAWLLGFKTVLPEVQFERLLGSNAEPVAKN
jgi:hypothetical protein